ncbi:MAG: hypothetical protein F6K16_25845 [Symploca sp. SIO2B6]|nr:hypothetical protein [Symploca sp. SIO2B6]
MRWTKNVQAYLLASLTGIIIFSPWLLAAINNWWKVVHVTHWMTISQTKWFLLKIWGLHLSRVFIDLGFDLNHVYSYIVPPLILVLVSYALYFFCRHTSKRVWLLVIVLIAASVLPLILPDLIIGGRRSVSTRYFVPCYISIQVIVAYLLANGISLNYGSKSSFPSPPLFLIKGIMVLLVSAGVISCAISSQANTWWNKYVSSQNHKIARVINQTPQPLILSDTSDSNVGNVISLSYLLEDKVRLQLVLNPNVPKIADCFSDVFLYYPSQVLRQGIEQEYGGKIELVDNVNGIPLWKWTR